MVKKIAFQVAFIAACIPLSFRGVAFSCSWARRAPSIHFAAFVDFRRYLKSSTFTLRKKLFSSVSNLVGGSLKPIVGIRFGNDFCFGKSQELVLCRWNS